MSELALSDFLSQLGNETIDRLHIENKSRIIPGTQSVKEEKKVELPQHRERKPIIIEEEIVEDNNSRLDEDFIETALDYASIVVKTVRKSFDSINEKRKVFESIRSAIDIYLGEYQQQIKKPSLFPPQTQNKMSEAEFDSMPTIQKGKVPGSVNINDLTGQPVNLDIKKPNGIMESDSRIGITVGTDGKKHADLSHMSDDDFTSLRVLSGIENAPK